MRTIIITAAIAALITTPALAQTAAGSTSGSNATATSGSTSLSVSQGGAATSGATASTGASTAMQSADNAGNQQAITFNDAPALKTQRLVTAPPVAAPGLTTTLSETCMGSRSGGISVMGFGGTGGATYTDDECVTRLDARELASWGDREAARAVMCTKPRVYKAYEMTGNPCPQSPNYRRPQPVAQVNTQPSTAHNHVTMAPIPNPRHRANGERG